MCACHREAAPIPLVRALPDAGTALSPMPVGLSWKSPPDWGREAFPLPPSFAQDLPPGLAEIRHAPGYAAPASPGYSSEAFVWWLHDTAAVEGSTLAPLLEHYFKGRCEQMAGGRFTLAPEHFVADLARVSEPATDETESNGNLRGTLESYDCQVSGKPWTLRLRVSVVECPQSAHRAVVVLASPAAEASPIWHELKARGSELSCL